MKNLSNNINKVIIWTIVIVLAVSLVLSLNALSVANTSPRLNLTIAIDAGHGGIDGGCVGKTTGKDENYLNLEYSKTLEQLLKNYNINVVMTRTNLNGLYNAFAENKKLDDMRKRKEIVNNSGANILIGMHMNSFPLSSSKGAQVFYKAGDEKSATLANCIQSVFIKTLPDARLSTSTGDYYMLNEFSIPAVIVECGYLSNPEEEQLLITDEYRELVCGAIFIGIVSFLSK